MSTALVSYRRKACVDKYGHRHPATTVKRSVEKKKRVNRKRRKTQRKDKWFNPKIHSGWSKNMPAKERRKLVLKAHHGNLLSAGRSKQALANVTKDEKTKVLATADARYFFAQNRKVLR